VNFGIVAEPLHKCDAKIYYRVYNKLFMKNKVVWITGGKRIGQSIAEAFAREGANIIVTYRSSSKEAEKIIRKAKTLKVRAFSLKCDVSSKESVTKTVREIRRRFKKVDILVNMASVFSPVEFSDVKQGDWDSNFNAHVLGTFWPSQIGTKIMPRGGHIINIADRTSIGKSYRGYLPYIVTKGAVASMTKALAAELAPKGIFVNAIAPGPILRPDDISENEWKKIRNISPLKYPINDDEAVKQFSLLAIYLSKVRMASGYIYPLDQGQNL
jgi:NAD(P)-dependent dehydrogenase (short-subunit alcohol dehydrogenase family)